MTFHEIKIIGIYKIWFCFSWIDQQICLLFLCRVYVGRQWESVNSTVMHFYWDGDGYFMHDTASNFPRCLLTVTLVSETIALIEGYHIFVSRLECHFRCKYKAPFLDCFLLVFRCCHFMNAYSLKMWIFYELQFAMLWTLPHYAKCKFIHEQNAVLFVKFWCMEFLSVPLDLLYLKFLNGRPFWNRREN